MELFSFFIIKYFYDTFTTDAKKGFKIIFLISLAILFFYLFRIKSSCVNWTKGLNKTEILNNDNLCRIE